MSASFGGLTVLVMFVPLSRSAALSIEERRSCARKLIKTITSMVPTLGLDHLTIDWKDCWAKQSCYGMCAHEYRAVTVLCLHLPFRLKVCADTSIILLWVICWYKYCAYKSTVPIQVLCRCKYCPDTRCGLSYYRPIVRWNDCLDSRGSQWWWR